MTKRKTWYRGLLDEPILGPRSRKLPACWPVHGPLFPELTTDEELEWWEKHHQIENEKLDLLRSHHEIDPDLPISEQWENLCHTLVLKHETDSHAALDQLFDRYHIPGQLSRTARWRSLARALAREYVPGFSIKGQRGRPGKRKTASVNTQNGSKKRGRPRASDFSCGMFVRMVGHYKKIHGIRTEKAAIRSMLFWNRFWAGEYDDLEPFNDLVERLQMHLIYCKRVGKT